MTEHPAASSCYYYTPQGLLASYLSLKHKEEEEALAALPTFNDPSASPIDHAANHQHHLRSERLVVAAVQLTSPPSTMAVHTGSVIPTSTTPIISALSQTSTNTLHHSDVHSFWTAAQEAVLQAAQQGANVILLPELFMGPYFCQSQEYDLMTQLPESVQDSFVIRRMQQFAQHLQVVLIISMYEKKNNMRYNSVVVIDADGSIVGTYRKSHIPDGPGYQEKFYFSPGGDGADGGGLRVFPTRHGKIGVAICWDQWFPEVARILALQGADVLLYPTAIGSEPSSSQEEGEGIKSSADHWQRVMQGHAAANMIPVVAANRYGTEVLLLQDHHDVATTWTERQRIHFYGRSFITDETGAVIKQAKDGADILVMEIDVRQNEQRRAAWGLFRDRRPDLYKVLLTKDGSVSSSTC